MSLLSLSRSFSLSSSRASSPSDDKGSETENDSHDAGTDFLAGKGKEGERSFSSIARSIDGFFAVEFLPFKGLPRSAPRFAASLCASEACFSTLSLPLQRPFRFH